MPELEVTDEFSAWYGQLSEKDAAAVNEAVDVLEELGPGLGRPLVDSVKGARTGNLKELRIGSIRILFAFDPRRAGILLLGGDKRGQWERWYESMVPLADRLYEEHIGRLSRTERRQGGSHP